VQRVEDPEEKAASVPEEEVAAGSVARARNDAKMAFQSSRQRGAGLKCFPKIHVLKDSSPSRCCWEVAETFQRWGQVRGPRSLETPLKGYWDLSPFSFSLLPSYREVSRELLHEYISECSTL
jgi:hypothetical protein